MCKVLQVSRSSYYNWRKNPEGVREIKKESMKANILKAYIDTHGYYGSPRLTVELCSQNKRVSRTTVARYMKEMKLKSKLKRKFIATTSSDHKEPVAENLLNRQFNPTEPGVAYVSDITYLRTLAGFIYLTTVIDLFDRKVIGWAISYGMSTEETVLPALRMAVKNRKPKAGAIFHSDRGVQYACKKTRNLLLSHGFIQSMSRKGNCWDNAVAESFFKTLKCERIYGYKLKTKEELSKIIFEYIEIWYNRRRRHSALNNLTIEEFWRLINKQRTGISNVA